MQFDGPLQTDGHKSSEDVSAWFKSPCEWKTISDQLEGVVWTPCPSMCVREGISVGSVSWRIFQHGCVFVARLGTMFCVSQGSQTETRDATPKCRSLPCHFRPPPVSLRHTRWPRDRRSVSRRRWPGAGILHLGMCQSRVNPKMASLLVSRVRLKHKTHTNMMDSGLGLCLIFYRKGASGGFPFYLGFLRFHRFALSRAPAMSLRRCADVPRGWDWKAHSGLAQSPFCS